MAAVAVVNSAAQPFEEFGPEQLVQISERIEVVIEDRVSLVPKLVPLQPMRLIPVEAAPKAELGKVLSPTQVRTFLNCSARWWFKYALSEPETKNSALALGSAVHRALEANFREKVTTKEDLDNLGVVALFREAWQQQVAQAEFRDDEDPAAFGQSRRATRGQIHG